MTFRRVLFYYVVIILILTLISITFQLLIPTPEYPIKGYEPYSWPLMQ